MGYNALNVCKAILSFLWAAPFAYMFFDIYFELDYRLPSIGFKIMIFLSLFSAFVLVTLWIKDFMSISYQSKAFKYLKEENLLKLDNIISKVNLEEILENNTTLLKYAIDHQLDSNIITYLISKDARVIYTPNEEYNVSYSLFYICAYYNFINIKMIQYLVNQGANINFIDNTKGFDGLSVIHTLILRSHKEGIELLIELGADLNYFVNDLSMNALMIAAKYVDEPFIIKQIIENGAKINDTNKDGYNALLFAAQYNKNPSVIRVLHNYGCEIKPYKVRSSILKHNYVTPLFLAASYNTPDVVKTLIKLGDDIHYKDHFGLSVLFVAASHNSDIDVIKALFKAGAVIEKSKDADGNTPLMAAAYLNSNPTIIRYLIERSHNLRTKNKDGFDFIDYLKQNNLLSDEEKSIIVNKWI